MEERRDERGEKRGERREVKPKDVRKKKMRGETRWGEVGGYWVYIYLDLYGLSTVY